ncbi:ABC transporter substrate-binding protein [Serratia marcescens]|uniref:ABC transporter substrate-binding protein n=1 Tax=Serratia TaxID=613 RepID=UPI0003964AC4|nr:MULTISPECIES: ABC transporter substrate-binding protein [Serratia]EIT7186996.1 ABC transporter substrate-binding protein [Serratia marcescens]EJC6393455.1 ABC transporter substrate-binding protein [Serratia marcescens]ERH72313.1 ABC transporter substrate-binding protein [Serratia marcescens EGD-HP20]NVC32216.1 ABC transporter substrate-binding protein [Serratia marcescens]NVC48039.1 ABC transporter substrate-binding protein [Serratia marcescens]
MKTTFKRTVLSLLLASSTLAPLAAGHAAEGDVPFKAALKAAADPALHDSLPEAIKKAGYIVAGTNPNTPPTTFYQADNKTLAGREIDVMSAIADRLGVGIHWKDTGGFDNIIPGLKSGRYDVALANIDANKKRFQQVDFVGYYHASKLALIARKDAALGPYTELAQLCGQTVGAGAGTSQITRLQQASDQCVAAGKPAITMPIFPDRPAGVQAVISGRVPMFFGPYEGLRYQATHVKPLTLAGDINIDGTTVAIALPKGSELVKPVQAALNSLIADGSYQKILDGWDIGFGAVKTAGINEEIAK